MFISHVTPEELGISSQTIVSTLESLRKLDSVNSIMILRHGKCCLEAYWRPFQAEYPHALFSLSKSFVSSAIGIAQSEGRLALTDKVISFFPEYQNVVIDPKMNEVTVQDLLTMRSGHSECPNAVVLPTENWVRTFLSTELKYQPGTHFAYNSIGTYMLAAIIRKLTGQNVREYLIPRLFTPLDIQPGIWECCPMGISKGGWGLHLKTEDLAKFGQLLLQNGNLNGRQLIPADYLAEATSKQADNSMNEAPDWKLGYGYQFWRCKYGYRGDGASGQYVVVLPEQDMTIAVTSGLPDMQRILTIFWEQLIPGLSNQELPANPDAFARIQEMKQSLEIPYPNGDICKRGEDKSFHFQDNKAGITNAELHFGLADCSLVFHYMDGHTETIRAGFGYRIENTLQIIDVFPCKVFVASAWIGGKLVLDLCNAACYRDTIIVDLENSTTPFTMERRIGVFQPSYPKLLLR